MSFDACDRGIEPHVVLVDAGAGTAGAPPPAGTITIGVDARGVLPRIDPRAFDLAITSAAPPPRAQHWVQARDAATEAERLRAAVLRLGQPAVMLAQLLRAGEGLGVADGLLLESLAYATLLGGRGFRTWLAAQPRRDAPHAGASAPVRLERQGTVFSIVLANPARRNAFGAAMRDALVEALAVAAADPLISAVEIRADGPDFCSGGDLAEFGSCDDLPVGHAIRMLRSPARMVAEARVPVTAFLHGWCIGAGIEIPAAATQVVARADARFRLPELAMGLLPGAGGTVTIARRIGRQRLLHWALGGEAIDAATALAWGLVDRIVGAERPQ